MKTLTAVAGEDDVVVYGTTDPFGSHVFEVPAQALLNRTAALAAADAELQASLDEGLLTGVVATYCRAAEALSVGDVVCSAASVTTERRVKLADETALAASPGTLGVALAEVAAEELVLVALRGLLPSAITGLSAEAGPVRVSDEGRCELVDAFSTGDYPVGTVDSAGVLTLSPGAATASGGTVSQTLVAGLGTVDTTTWTAVGGGYFDPTATGNPNFVFRALLSASSGLTAELRLFNLDDAVVVHDEADEAVGVLSTTEASPTLRTYSLVAGTTTGFPAAAKTYSVQVRLASGGAPDVATCTWAHIVEVTS